MVLSKWPRCKRRTTKILMPTKKYIPPPKGMRQAKRHDFAGTSNFQTKDSAILFAWNGVWGIAGEKQGVFRRFRPEAVSSSASETQYPQYQLWSGGGSETGAAGTPFAWLVGHASAHCPGLVRNGQSGRLANKPPPPQPPAGPGPPAARGSRSGTTHRSGRTAPSCRTPPAGRCRTGPSGRAGTPSLAGPCGGAEGRDRAGEGGHSPNNATAKKKHTMQKRNQKGRQV